MTATTLTHRNEQPGPLAILLVSANKTLQTSLQKSLHGMNCDLLTASSEDSAKTVAAARKPALVLVDRDRHDWHALRRHAPLQLIPMATLQSSQSDSEHDLCVNELEEGLDACWCDQTLRQIVAHIRSVLRRHLGSSSDPTAMKIGRLHMDVARHEVRVSDRLVDLTLREFQILKQFMESPGLVLSRQELLNRVWGVDYALEEHALDVHIHSLRQKIEPEPSKPAFILTIRGVGYKLHTT
jgi:DNA-binding response OmpR family regulator